MNAPSDETLVRQVAQGPDRAALATLVGRYDRRIYSFLARMLRNPHLAEEAAQETFLRMLRGLPTYRSDLPFERWLYRIALNCARTMAVRRQEQRIRERVASRSRREGGVTQNPAEGAFQNEVRGLVQDLPQGQKEALVLHYFQGLSHSEVAALLDVPAGTVATRIHGGLETLRGQLGSAGIVLSVGGLVTLLGESVAEAAPASILEIALAQLPTGTVAATAALQGGLLVTHVKFSTMAAVALLCLAGGTVIGYHARATHDLPEGENRLASNAREPRVPPREAGPGEVSPKELQSGSSTSSPPESPLEKPLSPVSSSPQEAKASKLRRLGAFMGRLMKGRGAKTTVNLSAQDAAELMGFMSDPELAAKMEKGPQGFLGADSADFMIAFLEEQGVHLTAEQKAWFGNSQGRKAADPAADTVPSASSVDQALSELRASRELVDHLKTILTPDQGKLVLPILGQGFSNGSVVAVDSAAPEEVPGAILDAWSNKLVTLSDQDRLLLSASASAYAQRLGAIQENLVARYGPEVFTLLTNPLEVTMTTGAKPSAPPSGNPERDSTALEANRIIEIFDIYEQLLGLESQERQALVALLPDRADEIRKAAPFVVVFSGKR